MTDGRTGSNGQARVYCNDGKFWTYGANQISGFIDNDVKLPCLNFADCIANEGDLPCRGCAEYALDSVGAISRRAENA